MEALLFLNCFSKRQRSSPLTLENKMLRVQHYQTLKKNISKFQGNTHG